LQKQEFTPRFRPYGTQYIAFPNCQNINFNTKNDGENEIIRIDSYFRAHIEFKRPELDLKIYREAIAPGAPPNSASISYYYCNKEKDNF